MYIHTYIHTIYKYEYDIANKMILVAQEKTKRNSSSQKNRSPGSPHTQPVQSSAVKYPPGLLTQYLLRPAEASPPGPIALSLLPLSVEYIHNPVEKTEEKIRSATHTDTHRDRKGRAGIHATAQEAMGISDMMFPKDINHHQVKTID